MPETRWRVTLDNRASRNAVKLTRDLKELAQALRDVKAAGAGLDLGGLGGLGGAGGGGRRSGGGRGGSGSGGSGGSGRGLDRVRKAHRDSIRDVGRAQKDQGRESDRQWRSALRSQREQVRLFRQRDRNAGRSARDEGRARAVRERREASERREMLGAGLGGTARVLTGIVAATMAAAAVITGIIASVGALVLRLSEAVLEMIAFREASIATLGLMSEGRTAQERQQIGRQEFQWARGFARETPLDVRDVINLRTQAATSGFRGNQARDVVMAAADVGASNSTNPMAAQRFTTAIGQIRGKGTLQTQELNQLAEAGVGRDSIYSQIARQRGITGTQAQINTRVMALIERRQVKSDEGVRAVLDAVRERSGGELGGTARAQGGTLLGTLSNVRGALADFVLGVENIEHLPGIEALKKMLNQLVDVMTGTGPVAVRLQETFASIVNEAAQFVGEIGGKEGIAGIIGRAVDAFEVWAPIIREVMEAFGSSFWTTIVSELTPLVQVFGAVGQDREGTVAFAREFGKSLAVILAFGIRTTIALGALIPLLVMVAEKVLAIVEALVSLRSVLAGGAGMLAGGPLAVLSPILLGGSAMSGIREQFAAIGADVPEGMRDGIEANRDGVLASLSTLNADMQGTTRADLQIHSPSRLFAELGAQVPAGMAEGIDGGAMDVQRSMAGMVAPAGLGDFGGASAGLGGVTFGSVTFQIMVPPGTDPSREMAERAFEHFASMMERASLAGGP